MKILKSQIEIIVGTLIFIIIYFLMWILLFTPIKNRNTQLKNYLEHTNSMVEAIEASVSQKLTLAEVLENLNHENKQITKFLSLTSENNIQLLKTIAKQNKLQIQSTNSLEKKPLLLNNQNVSTLAIQEEIVELKLTGRFIDLLSYLERLRNTPDLYFNIIKLDIQKPAGPSKNCEIILNLKLFLSA